MAPPRASAISAELGEVEREELRRQEVVGEDDGVLRQLARHRRLLAAQHANHLVLEIAQVGGSLAHARIVERGERCREPARGLAPRGGGAAAAGDRFQGEAKELRILHQLRVGTQ